MLFDYDILIAGAGPAGCAAAYDLAQAGRRVLLLDRRTFPRPKACACGLTRKTLKALRYSVDPIIERVCNEIVLQRGSDNPATNPGGPSFPVSSERVGSNEARTSTAPRQAAKSEEVRIHSRNPICAMAVRERFDHFCLQQTLASGRNGGSVTLRKIESIAALRELPTHIELDILSPTGPETLRSPVLIGADGSNGQTRRLAETLSAELSEAEGAGKAEGAGGFSPLNSAPHEAGFSRGPSSAPPQDPPWYTRGFALEALIPYTSLPATLPAGDAPHDLVFDFSPIPGGYGWLFPKGDHINIGVGAFAPEPAPTPDAPEARLKAVTRTLLADYTRQKLGVALPAEVTGQHLGMGGHAYLPSGRVLLAGDAAGLVDPLTGEGIHSAIVSGQAAAAAILETLSTNLSYRPDPERAQRVEGAVERPASRSAQTTALAAAYARHLAPLQQTLAFSHRAARAFYREPQRGFRAMKLPFLRSLVLKTYADGLPHTRLLTALAKLI
jgi:flavin-dependent dehydrogenase